MILTWIFLVVILSIITLFFLPNDEIQKLQTFGLLSSGLILILSCLVLVQFKCNSYFFQYIINCKINIGIFNVIFSFGLDGLSIFFLILSTFLIFLCILFVWNIYLLKEYLIILFLITLLLLLIFTSLDILLFYIFFESILIPMYLLIGLGGSRQRKIRAAYLFFFYTFLGSLLMLVGILYIYSMVGTLSLEYVLLWEFSLYEQRFLWIAFFLSFASKIPMFPFHVWLPEAHVEAPTVGSVLLAGILLKLGVYGFLRFSLTLFPLASLYYSPFIYLISIVSIIFASLSAIRQTDLKRIVAYSSISHMNLVVLGIFSFNLIGLEGAVLQSISHGFVSGAMFFLIGIIYERYHSRFIYYYGGLVHMMPLYAIFLFLFTLANIAVPGTSSFVGELLLLLGIYKTNVSASIISATGVILCGIYSLWLYNRIVFGNLKINYTISFKDITYKEFFTLFPLAFFVFFTGIYPFFISNIINLSLSNLSVNLFY